MDPECTDFIQTERRPKVHWAHAHREGAQGAPGSCTQRGRTLRYTGFMQTSCREKLF